MQHSALSGVNSYNTMTYNRRMIYKTTRNTTTLNVNIVISFRSSNRTNKSIFKIVPNITTSTLMVFLFRVYN